MNIKEILKKEKEIWDIEMQLSDIIPAMGKVFGDICRWQRDATKDKNLHTEEELKKELGNIITSTIRWCDNLGYDPEDCIKSAIKAQEKFVMKEKAE